MSRELVKDAAIWQAKGGLGMRRGFVLHALAYELQEGAQMGRTYSATIARISGRLGVDRALVSKTIKELVAMEIVLRDGRKLGIADPDEVVAKPAKKNSVKAERSNVEIFKSVTGGHVRTVTGGHDNKRKRKRGGVVASQPDVGAPFSEEGKEKKKAGSGKSDSENSGSVNGQAKEDLSAQDSEQLNGSNQDDLNVPDPDPVALRGHVIGHQIACPDCDTMHAVGECPGPKAKAAKGADLERSKKEKAEAEATRVAQFRKGVAAKDAERDRPEKQTDKVTARTDASTGANQSASTG